MRASIRIIGGMAAGMAFLIASEALAGVGTMPHFVTPGNFAVGIEPELTLTNGAGIGVNFKYTHGLNELMNLTGVIGTSGGPRKFRIGGDAAFDFFPDVEGQPGIGVAAQGIYYRLENDGLFELTAVPYIHKTFISSGNEVEPYFAFPFGVGFISGSYHGTTQAVVGAMFKSHPSFRFNLEFGINVNNTESTISGGVTYFH